MEIKENDKETIETIEHEIIVLMRRADFKRTLDGKSNSLDRSGYLLLDGLLKHGPTSFRALSALLQLDISTVSRQINTLEKKEYVERVADKLDRRVSMLSLTEKGRDALLSAKKDRKMAYSDMLSDWTTEEKEIFADLLSRLNHKIEQRRKLR